MHFSFLPLVSKDFARCRWLAVLGWEQCRLGEALCHDYSSPRPSRSREAAKVVFIAHGLELPHVGFATNHAEHQHSFSQQIMG